MGNVTSIVGNPDMRVRNSGGDIRDVHDEKEKIQMTTNIISDKPMSKAEVARRLGVSRTHITLLLNGKRKMSKPLADKLAILLMTVDIKSSTGRCGPLAQLAEHLTFNQGVTGSRPVRPTLNLFNLCKHFTNTPILILWFLFKQSVETLCG